MYGFFLEMMAERKRNGYRKCAEENSRVSQETAAWNGLEMLQPPVLLGFCSYLFIFFPLTRTSK